MLFNSYVFLLGFLPAAFLIYWFADKSDTWRTRVLIVLSLIFYGYWDVRFVPLLIGSILVNWYGAKLYAASKSSALITCMIVLDLAVLGVFKYFNFFAANLHAVFGVPLVRAHWALPLGISFFTFHHIMYLVDLRRGRASTYPLDKYALYICFFPQAIAGPIARWSEVMEQFGKRAFQPGWQQRCALGVTFVVLGLLQKIMLGDPLARIIYPVYQHAATGPLPAGQGWLALAFGFQVLFDFAGYSDIAIGLGLMFGIVLPRNFDGPFRATSIVDLWQRWHMTLARFLRDYVFTPLSRVRIGGGRHRMTRALVAIMLTMALCGLWHGAGWTYVLWGTLQGVGIVFAAAWSRNLPSPPAIVGWAATLAFFLVTCVMFRAPTLEATLRIYHSIATGLPADTNGFRTIAIAAFCAVVLPPSHVIAARLTDRANYYVAASLAAATVVVLLEISRFEYEFIYFQF